jgi:fluoride exporter
MRGLTAVFIGGVAGALARAGVADALAHDPGRWPWATLLVNAAGAFLLGWVAARGFRRELIGQGFCGALTTFSTFQLELLQMLDHDRIGLAAGYAAVSVALGLAAAELGRRAA